MSDHTQQAPLSGQQISVMQARFNEAIQALYADVRLREQAVEQARKDRYARRYDRLVNALLRRLARDGVSALQDRDAFYRPIAGTRKRGRDPREDDALAAELAADPKERAEHIMLVDLGRNDLGRVSTYGSVNVERLEDHSAADVHADRRRDDSVAGRDYRTDRRAIPEVGVRHRGDVKEHVVLGDIGEIRRDEPLDQHLHFLDVLGRARLDIRRQTA